MEGRRGGSFPGGPSRGGTSEGRRRASRLERVADIEARVADTSVARTRRGRRRRAILGLMLSVLAAGGLGVALGVHSRMSAEEVAARNQVAARPADLDISREVNRALLELWRMEEAEMLRIPR